MSDILEVLSKLEFNGTVDAKTFINQIFFETDQTHLNDLRKSFKTKFLDKFEKQLNSITTKDIDNIFDPLGLSKSVRNIDELKKDLQEYKSKLKKTLKKANKDLDDLESDKTGDQSNDKNATPQARSTQLEQSSQTDNTIDEQRTLGEDITTVEFSPKASAYIDDLFDTYVNKVIDKSDKTNELLENYNNNNNVLLDKRRGEGGSFIMNLLGVVGALLATGVGVSLLAANWENHVKPWLEDFFDKKGAFDFLDKYKGIGEAVGKFFTMGGLNVGGVLFKSLGNLLEFTLNIFTKSGPGVASAVATDMTLLVPKIVRATSGMIGSVLKYTLGSFFEGGLGTKAAVAGAEGGGLKSLLPKIAGGLFRGMGSIALRGVPVVGSLLSFYFALGRYEKGDYIGALIDVVSGLGDLLYFTPLAPLALPISLGAAVLNSILDYKATGKTPEEKQQSKIDILGGIATGTYNLIKRIPFIGALIRGSEGYMKFGMAMASDGNAGDVIAGLKMMEDSPFSIFPAIFLPFYEAAVSTDKQGNKKIKFGNLYVALGKKILSGMPDWLKSIVAPFFGIDSPLDELTAIESPEDLKSKIYETERLAKKKQKEIDTGGVIDSDKEQAQAEVDALVERLIDLKEYSRLEKEKQLERNTKRQNDELEKYRRMGEEMDKKTYEPTPTIIPKYDKDGKLNPRGGQLDWPTENVDDNIEMGSVKIFNGNRIKTTHKDDATVSAKPNGFIDKGLKDLSNIMKSVDGKLSDLIKAQKTSSTSSSPVIVNNSTTSNNSNNNKEYLMSPVRDSNWLHRMNYYNASLNLKSV